MKKNLLAALLATLATTTVWADTVTLGGGASFISTSGFAATTGINSNPSVGTPFWNNYSTDGVNVNAGYFLTGTGAFSTNFLGTTPVYAGTPPSSTSNATNFEFLRDASSIAVTLLFASAATNNIAGNEFGFYDTATNARTVISSTLPNAFNGATALGSFNTSAGYGFYATVCMTVGTCNTFYSNSALNTGGLGNQHLALFRDNATSTTQLTYYIALERLSPGPAEGYGDYNDIIFQVTTSHVPEPTSLSFVGLGYIGPRIHGPPFPKLLIL